MCMVSTCVEFQPLNDGTQCVTVDERFGAQAWEHAVVGIRP
jgi:hypothetical protein